MCHLQEEGGYRERAQSGLGSCWKELGNQSLDALPPLPLFSLFGCDGTLTKSHLRKELVYLAYISRSIIEGYQGKDLEGLPAGPCSIISNQGTHSHGSGAETMEDASCWLVPRLVLSWLPCIVQVHLPREWCHPHGPDRPTVMSPTDVTTGQSALGHSSV